MNHDQVEKGMAELDLNPGLPKEKNAQFRTNTTLVPLCWCSLK